MASAFCVRHARRAIFFTAARFAFFPGRVDAGFLVVFHLRLQTDSGAQLLVGISRKVQLPFKAKAAVMV